MKLKVSVGSVTRTISIWKQLYSYLFASVIKKKHQLKIQSGSVVLGSKYGNFGFFFFLNVYMINYYNLCTKLEKEYSLKCKQYVYDLCNVQNVTKLLLDNKFA